nr:hypothetical protein [Nonomuraea polychroma]
MRGGVLRQPDPPLRDEPAPDAVDLQPPHGLHPHSVHRLDRPLGHLHPAVPDAARRQPRGAAVDVGRVEHQDVHALEAPQA